MTTEKPVRMRRLPDGTTTDDVDRYLDAWHDLMDPLAFGLGWTIHSFDPGAAFVDHTGAVISLTVAQVQRICDWRQS